ncbi:SDR family NAD(P)-dependent oxidoreductase [Streptomyces nodosus]|uniref:Oxidoreductase n=1 Tax=Streptomyces nodosus TaxID=40318 RepID=A0A0B5DW46_9ACTN|nr:SDR family oxidoreductase [Streptomyces nodosus]AJE44457.1 oxidoreductase [Streptomyces nodosus]MBB4796110.1 NAD(P)-dependent dehydrogenase (short-subunit alcohol dehydrogenase family) [Streptomyces nodosus]QEV42940.1 SDR family oxidoreductase [Streptomyces nodosus]
MSTLLQGKVAVITGGSDGIGLATARRFVAEGAKVVIGARRQERLDKATAELGPDVIGVRLDAASLDDLDHLFEVVRATYERVDVLVANASIAEQVSLGELTEAHVDRTLAVNIKGMVFTVQKALPLLVAGASIILTSSVDNQVGGPGRSIYSATKAVERNLVRSWLVELADRRIRVNVLAPGATATNGLLNLVGARDIDAMSTALGQGNPRGSIIQPDEVAKAALFLASDLASGVNGIELTIDGGFGQVR